MAATISSAACLSCPRNNTVVANVGKALVTGWLLLRFAWKKSQGGPAE